MNEQLQSKLVEILSAIQNGAKAAGDFALEQLPDIAQQYVAYGRAIYAFHVVAAIVALVLLSLALVRAWRWMRKEEPELLPLMIFPAIAYVPIVMWCAFVVEKAALVWIAPKVWLLKELASLVK